MSQRVRFHLPPLLAWTAVWAIFFAPLLLGTARLPGGDFAGQFHAFGLFQMRQIAQGQLPLWSPGSYAGFPFAADPQAAVFYPLRWLTLLLSLPGGFTRQMLTLEGLAHLWLAGLFTYGLAFSVTRQRPAALLAAVAFGLGGYLTSYPLLQLAILETVTWLPLLLLLLRRGALARERPLPWLAAGGGVLGVAALAGHPQTLLHVATLAAAYFLFLTARARWSWRWRLGLGAAIVAVAAGVAAVAALPAWRYLALTTRSDVSYDFVSRGFPLLNYLHLLLPRTLSLWTPEYVGLLPLALALLALWGRRHGRQAAEILFWGVTAAVAAWVSLGDKGILFELIFHVVPGYDLFRQQERLVSLVSLSVALLAAQGVALWLQITLARRRALLRRVIPLVGGGVLLGGVILTLAQSIANDDWLLTWGRQLLLATAALALLWFGRRRHAALLFIPLLAVDLLIPVRTAMDLQPQSPHVFWPQPAWLETLQAENPGRIDSRHLFHANVGEIYGLEDVRGISPLQPQLVARFETLPRPLRWQLLHVTHVLAEEPLQEPGLTAVTPIRESIIPGETVTATLYRFQQALPRAWISYEPIPVPDTDSAFQALQAPDFDPARQVVLTAPEGIDFMAGPPPPAAPPVQVTRPANNRLALTVETAVPGILVVSEWAVPGWRAVVNGAEVTPLTANGGLLALPLAAGAHQIALRYVPPGLAAGALVTAVTLLLTVLVAWRWRPVVVRQRADARVSIPIPARWRKKGDTDDTDLTDFSGFFRRLKNTFTRENWPYSFNPRRHLSFKRLEAALQTHWRLIMWAVVFLGFGLRLWGLGAQELRGDEAFSYLFARLPAAEIVPALLAEGDPHSPLHYWLLHGWMALAGDSEIALRFPSLAAGVLLLPLLAQLGRHIGGRINGRPLGVLAALLLATSQSQVWIGQDVRHQYVLALLFILMATLLLARLTGRGNGTRINTDEHRFLSVLAWARKRPWGWLVYAVLCALAVYSHYYAAFALLGHGVYVLFAPQRKYFWRWVGAGVVAALLFLPWAVPMTGRLLAAGQLSDPSTPELATHLTTVGVELIVGSAASGSWQRWLFLVGLALSVVGARRLWQRRPAWAGLLLTWLGGTVLALYLIRFHRETFNPFYITVAAPVWWLLVAAGLRQLWHSRRAWWRAAAVFALLTFFAVAALSLRNYYVDPQYSRTLGYRPMAAHVAAQYQPGDLFLAHFPDPSLVYYLRHVPIDYEMQPARYRAPAAETEAELAALAAAYERIWFVPAPGSAWDAENVVPDWLAAHTLREQETQHRRLTLLAYRPAHAVEEVTAPIERSLGEHIYLRGAYATVNGRPADLTRPLTVSPGDQLTVTLLWQSSRPLETHYTAFVQLLDENGVLAAQDDSVPVKGIRPTTTWRPGETIIDAHTLMLPADGPLSRGQIIVGMYETETVQRLLFDGGADAAFIATVQVEK